MENKNKKNNLGQEKIQTLLLFLYHYFYFFSLLVIIVIITIGSFVFVIPKYKKISEEIKSKDEAKQLELDYLNKYQVELTKFKASYARISKEDKEKVKKIYPEMKDIEELFTELSILVKKNGLLLNSIEVKKREEAKSQKTIVKKGEIVEEAEGAISGLPSDIGVIDVSLDISGVNYKSLKNILKTFENNLRILDVKDLNFEPGGSLSLELETYYVKSNEK